jgi:hypothetical protein
MVGGEVAGGGAGCGVGHVAHAVGCSFFFFALVFRFLFGVFVMGWVFRCLGMWGRVMFSLIRAFCVFLVVRCFGVENQPVGVVFGVVAGWFWRSVVAISGIGVV